MNSNWSYSPETTNFTSKLTIFVSYDLEIWRMTLKNNKVPLLCHTKLCASFHHYTWIQPGVKVRKRLNWVLTSVTFDLWPLIFASYTNITLSRVITPEFINPQSVSGNVTIFIFQLLKVTSQKGIYALGERLYGTKFFHDWYSLMISLPWNVSPFEFLRSSVCLVLNNTRGSVVPVAVTCIVGQ